MYLKYFVFAFCLLVLLYVHKAYFNSVRLNLLTWVLFLTPVELFTQTVLAYACKLKNTPYFFL